MKIDFGETPQEKDSRLSEWHKFFPLFPRQIGPHDYRCFEWIERKSEGLCSYVYRLPVKED